MNDYQFWTSARKARIPPLWCLAMAPIILPAAIVLTLMLSVVLLGCALLDWSDKPFSLPEQTDNDA
jgi:hypothetical protein